MTDEDIRIINRAICEVEDQDLREAARAALHRVFRKQARFEDQGCICGERGACAYCRRNR